MKMRIVRLRCLAIAFGSLHIECCTVVSRRAMRYVPSTFISGIISRRPPLTKGETRGPTTGRDFPMRRVSLHIQVTRDFELRCVVRRAQWTGLDSLRYRDGTAWRVTEFPDQVHAYGVHPCTALPYRLLRYDDCSPLVMQGHRFECLCAQMIRASPLGNGHVDDSGKGCRTHTRMYGPSCHPEVRATERCVAHVVQRRCMRVLSFSGPGGRSVYVELRREGIQSPEALL
jgi:hypothetical protein